MKTRQELEQKIKMLEGTVKGLEKTVNSAFDKGYQKGLNDGK